MDKSPFIEECCWHRDSGWSGQLIVGPSLIKATLNSFEQRGNFRSFQKENIELTLASGETATLFDCREALSGTRMTATKHIAHTELVPNYVLIGDRRWRNEDLVSSIEFCLPDARDSLSFGEHQEVDFEGGENDEIIVSKVHISRTKIGCVVLPDIEVSLSVGRNLLRSTRDDVGKDSIWILIKFFKPTRLGEIFQVPFNITTFFELSVGHPLRARGFVVHAHRDTSLPLQYDHIDYFEFYRTEEAVDPAQQYHEPVFKIWREEDRISTFVGLKQWLERRQEWAVTYWLAWQFVQGGREVNRANLLRAMAWYEAMPIYQATAKISAKRLKVFLRECRELESFKALGLPPERLGEVLNELRRVPLVNRMELSISEINKHMGSEFFSNDFLEDCKSAIRLRNKAAHGGDASLEEDFHKVVISTSAIETLTLVSTILSLGVPSRKIRLLTNVHCPHPYASYFSMKRLEYCPTDELS